MVIKPYIREKHQKYFVFISCSCVVGDVILAHHHDLVLC